MAATVGVHSSGMGGSGYTVAEVMASWDAIMAWAGEGLPWLRRDVHRLLAPLFVWTVLDAAHAAPPDVHAVAGDGTIRGAGLMMEAGTRGWEARAAAEAYAPRFAGLIPLPHTTLMAYLCDLEASAAGAPAALPVPSVSPPPALAWWLTGRNRFRVTVPTAALQLVLDFLSRHRHVYHLALLNSRVVVEAVDVVAGVEEAQGIGEGSTPGPAAAVSDAAAFAEGLVALATAADAYLPQRRVPTSSVGGARLMTTEAEAEEASGSKQLMTLKWGVPVHPWAHSGGMGKDGDDDDGGPTGLDLSPAPALALPDYRVTGYGRAVLSGAALLARRHRRWQQTSAGDACLDSGGGGVVGEKRRRLEGGLSPALAAPVAPALRKGGEGSRTSVGITLVAHNVQSHPAPGVSGTCTAAVEVSVPPGVNGTGLDAVTAAGFDDGSVVVWLKIHSGGHGGGLWTTVPLRYSPAQASGPGWPPFSITAVSVSACGAHLVAATSQPELLHFSLLPHAMAHGDSAFAPGGVSSLAILRATSDLHPTTILQPRAVGPSLCLQFNPLAPSVVAAGGADGVIRLWDLSETSSPQVLCAGHTGAITSVAFHPNGMYLVSTSVQDGTFRVWDCVSGACVRVIPAPTTSLVPMAAEVHPTGRYCAVAYGSLPPSTAPAMVHVIDLQSGMVASAHALLPSMFRRVAAVAWFTPTRLLLVPDAEGGFASPVLLLSVGGACGVGAGVGKAVGGSTTVLGEVAGRPMHASWRARLGGHGVKEVRLVVSDGP